MPSDISKMVFSAAVHRDPPADEQPWLQLKQTQEALREERNFASAVFETVSALVIVLERDGRIVRFNRACGQMAGYCVEECRGDFVWERFLDPEDASGFRDSLLQIGAEKPRMEGENRWITRGGKQKMIAWSAAVLPGVNLPSNHLIVSGIDVTEQRRADARYRALLDAAPEAVVVANQTGIIMMVNAQVPKMFGYERQEVLGAEIEMLVPARFRGKHPGHRRKFVTEPHVRPMGAGMELYALHKDGHEFPVEISLSPLETEDGLLTSSAIRDISERKRLEATILEIRDAEQNRIGQDLHDGLGQHLTGIAFMGKVLAERLAESSPGDQEQAAKIVKLVNESIKMARDLARGLLPQVSDAHGLTAALQHWAAEVSERFHVACRVECPTAVRVRDNAMADHLFRLTQEAVTNAVKHGRPRNIYIGLAMVMGGGVLTIRDDGCGFNPAGQSHPGLGLRIMSYRAKMIGGALSVQSSPNGGTVVRCMFPIGSKGTQC